MTTSSESSPAVKLRCERCRATIPDDQTPQLIGNAVVCDRCATRGNGEPDRSIPAHYAAMANPRPARPGVFFELMLGILVTVGVLFVLGGVITTMSSHRFDGDVAPGAMANATECLIGCATMLVGVVLLMLAVLLSINKKLDRLK